METDSPIIGSYAYSIADHSYDKHNHEFRNEKPDGGLSEVRSFIQSIEPQTPLHEPQTQGPQEPAVSQSTYSGPSLSNFVN
jgi:hypothetical protein